MVKGKILRVWGKPSALPENSPRWEKGQKWGLPRDAQEALDTVGSRPLEGSSELRSGHGLSQCMESCGYLQALTGLQHVFFLD